MMIDPSQNQGHKKEQWPSMFPLPLSGAPVDGGPQQNDPRIERILAMLEQLTGGVSEGGGGTHQTSASPEPEEKKKRRRFSRFRGTGYSGFAPETPDDQDEHQQFSGASGGASGGVGEVDLKTILEAVESLPDRMIEAIRNS